MSTRELPELALGFDTGGGVVHVECFYNVGRRAKSCGLVLAGLLCLCSSAWAQISMVHVTSCGPATFPGTTCTIPATGSGNLIVVGFATLPAYAPTISGVTDNAGNTYSEAGSARSIDSTGNDIVDLWYAKNSTAGSTTVTITPSTSGQAAATIWEFSNANTSSPLDQTVVLNSQTATTTASGGTVTTTAANEVIVSVMSPSGAVTGLQSGNAFTSDSLNFGVGWAHLIAASTGSYSAVWNASGTYASSSASFKAATSGSSGTSNSCDLNQDGVVNSADVTLAVNMALGTTPCTANVEGPDVCTVITVQRVVNASMGQTCILYNDHGVTLNWDASTSSNIAGYNIYRGTTLGTYTKLTTSGLVTGTTYSDSSVQAGVTYYYVATTVDLSGNESGYSSPATATIPTP